MNKRFHLITIALIFLLSACAPASAATEPFSATWTNTPSPTFTVQPTGTPVPSPVLPTVAPTAPEFQLSSPLEGIEVSELIEILTTPFDEPKPGLDDGHHGVDFAFYTHGDLKQMLDLPIHAVLPGEIAAVVQDRPPYGNMLIIETPLEDLPSNWLDSLNLPVPGPTPPPNPRLQCPPADTGRLDHSNRSLYLLYAHMDQKPTQSLGDLIQAGEPIGAVGNSGASGNPHLHLEARVGPSGARLDGMAHYINNASQTEMGNYCQWRISGQFQMIDPMRLFQTEP